MEIRPTEIPDVLVIQPRVFDDPRGFFKETYQRERYSAAGIDCEFVQDNYSRSASGTLRGLHYQIEHTQAKLIQVTKGAVFDVAVDLRKSSNTFGKWVGVHLSEDNHSQMFVPPGFAHGFFVLSERADILYKCSDYYYPEHERSLLWNDEQVAIDWPIDVGQEVVLSEKDRQGIPLAECECF